MAENGFPVRESLITHAADVPMSPFEKDSQQLSKEEVKLTTIIATKHIYVAQAIRRIKSYRILENDFPISLLVNIDAIIQVCAALTNLQGPLCR